MKTFEDYVLSALSRGGPTVPPAGDAMRFAIDAAKQTAMAVCSRLGHSGTIRDPENGEAICIRCTLPSKATARTSRID